MKKLTGLNEGILNLDGQNLLDGDGKKVVIKTIIANVLARGSSQEPARVMDLALKIYNAKDEIEIEDNDLTLIKEAIEKDQLMNNIAKAATLKVLK